MADESHGDKTEAPTPKRRRDAAEKGQVPRSQEVTTAFLLLAASGVVAWGTPFLARALVEELLRSAGIFTALPEGVPGASRWLGLAGRRALAATAPVTFALAGVALAVAAVQARGTVTVEPLKPKWERLDPVRKAREIWGARALVELAKSLLKLAIVSGAVLYALNHAWTELPALGRSHPFALVDASRRHAARMLAAAGVAYLALALADYAWQIYRHEKGLRMTRHEVKKELKEAEGDQVMKVRRRTMARQLARRRMIRSVPEADVVVTNPTRIAVALKYDPARAAAPVVLAMGERKVAERIRAVAREAGVPVVENRPLARALLATGSVGAPIPVELFVAVAEVLAFVYRIRSGGVPGPSGGARR